MKNKLRFPLIVGIAVLLFASCKKDEHKIYYEDGTPPVLTASTAGPLVLTKAAATSTAIKLMWTNPNYRFTTGISSQDVTYVLQVDTADGFNTAKLQEVSFSKDLEVAYTDTLLNAVLARMELQENIPHTIAMRLKATLGSSASVPLYSNVVKLTVTPYLDVAVPIPTNGNLWIVGDATANGWDNPLKPQYEVSQKFTKVSNTLYELTLPLPGGGGYKLLQDNGNWDTQFHRTTGTWDAGSFELKNADPTFPGPPSSGTYKITVNFKTGTYTVAKQ